MSQFFIAVAILLGVLEKTFFVAEYAVVNTQGVSCECEGEGIVGGEVPVRTVSYVVVSRMREGKE